MIETYRARKKREAAELRATVEGVKALEERIAAFERKQRGEDDPTEEAAPPKPRKRKARP